MTTLRLPQLALACACSLLAGACYNTYFLYGDAGDTELVQVHVPDPAPDYATYHAFAFNTAATPPMGMADYDDAILRELRENMEYRGFVYDETSADFVFNIYAKIADSSQDFEPYPCDEAYAYYYPCDYYETVSYAPGTLAIGLVDAGEERELWTAVIEGVFVDGDDAEVIIRRIRNNVDVAFDLSPDGIREGHG